MGHLKINVVEAIWLAVNGLGFSLALKEAVVNWQRYEWVEEVLKDSNGRLRMAKDNLVMAYILLVPLALFLWLGIYAAGRTGITRFEAPQIALMIASLLVNLGAIYVWARRKHEDREFANDRR